MTVPHHIKRLCLNDLLTKLGIGHSTWRKMRDLGLEPPFTRKGNAMRYDVEAAQEALKLYREHQKRQQKPTTVASPTLKQDFAEVILGEIRDLGSYFSSELKKLGVVIEAVAAANERNYQASRTVNILREENHVLRASRKDMQRKLEEQRREADRLCGTSFGNVLWFCIVLAIFAGLFLGGLNAALKEREIDKATAIGRCVGDNVAPELRGYCASYGY